MRELCPGDHRWGRPTSSGESRLHLDLQTLAVQAQAGSPLVPPAPISPEERSRSHCQGMKQDAHLAWFACRAAVPLALLTCGTRAASANAGPIHDAQAAIGFSAMLMRQECIPSGAAQRPIRLEGKVSPREAASFPGGGGGGERIS